MVNYFFLLIVILYLLQIRKRTSVLRKIKMIKRLNKIIAVHILIFNSNKSHPDANFKLEEKKCIYKYSIYFEE